MAGHLNMGIKQCILPHQTEKNRFYTCNSTHQLQLKFFQLRQSMSIESGLSQFSAVRYGGNLEASRLCREKQFSEEKNKYNNTKHCRYLANSTHSTSFEEQLYCTESRFLLYCFVPQVAMQILPIRSPRNKNQKTTVDDGMNHLDQLKIKLQKWMLKMGQNGEKHIHPM